MPVPVVLNTASSVFCYTSDLKDTSAYLVAKIGGQLINVSMGKGVITKVDVNIVGRKVAWLVGHGLATDTQIHTVGLGCWVELAVPLKWLEDNGYTHVVDTCCSPNLRRGVKTKLTYYCAADGQTVSKLSDAKDLDKWWDANGFK